MNTATYLLVAGALLAAPAAAAQTVAITGGTVYPVSGPKMDHATVLIRDGKIVAVGTDVTVPAGATRIDATGKWVTPGFFHGKTTEGLSVVGSVGETNEQSMEGDVNASFNVADGLNPRALTIPIDRLEGLTTVVSMPSGRFIQGQAAVIDMNGETLGDLLVRSPAGMAVDLTSGSKGAVGGSRAGLVERLRRLLDDAKEYASRRSDYRRNQIQELSASAADLEALQPVLAGTIPLLVTANRESDIRAALRIAQGYNLRLVILGGEEAWAAADALKAAGVPVGINTLTNTPTFDALGARLDNVTLVAEAGAPYFIIENETGGPRNLRYAAGEAVRNGLTWDQALAAITLMPARAYGVADQYGTLEPGKVANVVVWSGDPLDFPAEAEHVFIRGKDMPHENRQTELRERYRELPPTYQ